MPEKTYDEKADEALILGGLASDSELVETYRRLAICYRALARLHEQYHSDRHPESVASAMAHLTSR